MRGIPFFDKNRLPGDTGKPVFMDPAGFSLGDLAVYQGLVQ